MTKLVYNVGFTNSQGQGDETQLNVEKQDDVWIERIELINLILSLKEEMDIQEIDYIDYIDEEEEEE